jgi:hypothetical protein
MAYQFTAASSQSLNTTSTPVSAAPLTMAAWINYPNTGGAQGIVQLTAFGVNADIMRLVINPAQQVNFIVNGTGGFQSATVTSPAFAHNTWGHTAAVAASTTDRVSYYNGTASSTATNDITLNNLNRVDIGVNVSNTVLAAFSNGLIAEVGIWNAALTQPEIASLAKGMTCDKVRPQSLVFYAPLVRELQDAKGGLTITNNNGATVANHPRVYA